MKLNERKIVCRFLFPSGEQPACAVGPRVRSLDHPAAGFGLASPARGSRFAFLRDMFLIPSSAGCGANGFGVVPLVGAEMLPLAGRRPRTLHGDAGERFGHQLLVMHIRAADGDCERHAGGVDEDRSFDAQFAPIGRVGAGFFPRPAAPWSAPRPNSATASQSRPARHTRPEPDATASRTSRSRSTPESSREWRCPNRTPAAWLSTDIQCEEHRECQPTPSASATAGGPPGDFVSNGSTRCHKDSGTSKNSDDVLRDKTHLRARREKKSVPCSTAMPLR